MTKEKITLKKWDIVEQLKTEEEMLYYFEACLAEGDPQLIAAALGDIAKARGMTQVAEESGLSRESLYKALSADGNPQFATIMKVINALGLRLHTEFPSNVEDPKLCQM